MRSAVVLSGLCTLCLLPAGTAISAPAPASAKAPAVLSSGQRVVYESDVNKDGQPLIYTFTLEHTTPVQVTSEPASHPGISRSGDIYYNRVITPVWGIITKIYHRQWPNGTEQGVTANELGDEYQPAISRDNQILAFTAKRYFTPKVGRPQDVIDLMAYKRPFVEQRQLTQSVVVESNPAVDATGQYIYATQTNGEHTEVWRYAYKDARAERIAGIEEGVRTNCHEPAVDGQNRWCVYSSTRDGNSEIYIRDLKTMVETRLTTNESYDGQPSITEDGSRIVFVSDRDGDKELFAMDRTGGNLRQLTNNTWDDTSPSVQ